jgi:restriction system protein
VFDNVTNGIKAWLVGLFASAINHTSRPQDRVLAIRWLSQSRDIVASDARSLEKLKQLNALINSRAAIVAIAKSVSEAASNYRKSSLPWSMKIALPATLAAIPLVGVHGAGIAAFGGALGVPVLLLVFLGTAGISSIIEAERLRQTSAQMKAAMKEQPMDPTHFAMPVEEMALRQNLLSMDPYNFEQHSMSFFHRAGLEAWATKKSNDLGADGFAVHADGLIVVQCKRNATTNKVGRPTVQQFKGVVEEHNAYRGYVITTSDFTEEAIESAALTSKIVLVAMDDLVRWHAEPPAF